MSFTTQHRTPVWLPLEYQPRTPRPRSRTRRQVGLAARSLEYAAIGILLGVFALLGVVSPIAYEVGL